MKEKQSLRDVAKIFFRLGTLGFGGPLSTMSMMEEETSRRRQWVSTAEFNEAYTLCKILPGPAATQMAIYLGHKVAGFWGGIISGLGFILPSFFLVLALSWLYIHYGALLRFDSLFLGMQAAALAVIFSSLIRMATPYKRHLTSWLIGIVSLALVLVAPQWEPLIIIGAGLLCIVIPLILEKIKKITTQPPLSSVVPLFLWNSPFYRHIVDLFWVHFKAGAFVFGTGLAIIPLLEHDVVQQMHWLTRQEFLDGLAIGQITPGPVVITATFIGYKVAGILGAIAATCGIFTPAFFNILVAIPHLRRNFSTRPRVQAFISGAIPAVLGCIAGTTLMLSKIFLNSPLQIIILFTGLVLVLKVKLPSWLIIPMGGIVSFLSSVIL